MTLQEIRALAHIEILNHTKDIINFETLLNGIKKDSHEFLYILLLKALGVIPLETSS